MKIWLGFLLVISAAGLASSNDILEDAFLDAVSCAKQLISMLIMDSQ